VTLHHCPICKAQATHRITGSPYFECPDCLAWFQSPMPPKVYHGPEEPDTHGMSDADKEINRVLAANLFKHAMQSKRGIVLDVGAKLPVLASAFVNNHGCTAIALDAELSTARDIVDGVSMVRADFEHMDTRAFPKFDLITMVHVFEHMQQPLEALRKLHRLMAPNGRVFMRLPDHFVTGWERDLTPHHYAIHPFYHCLPSIMEALAQVRDLFVIEHTSAMPGAGQRDIVLRPITKAPRIACAMIVKNEERDLPRCLKSMEEFVDHIAIADTGSTDRTLIVAHTTINRPVVSETYLGASERNAAGDWQLWDFSKARNRALEMAEASGCDWVMWADADDEFMTPAAFRRAPYLDCYDAFKFWIDDNGSRWYHVRMFRATKRVRFSGMCHEYPVIDNCRVCNVDESRIVHHGAPVAGAEAGNARNLRMLLRQWDAEEYNDIRARTAFYLGNTHRDGGRHEEAANWYRKRVEMGDAGFQDERLFSFIGLSRELRALNRHDEADEACNQALEIVPHWAEFKMEIANGYYTRKRYAEAIAVASAIDTTAPIPPTDLWREVSQYRDQPPRLVSWCYEHEGEIEKAILWAGIAAARLDGIDAEWQMRTRRLIAQWDAQRKRLPAPAIIKGLRPLIALHRPGAIGDILMTLNLVPALKQANPDAEIHYYCQGGLAAPEQLGSIILQAGCAMACPAESLPGMRKRYERVVDLVGYPVASEGYPEHPMSKHLLQYFGLEMGIACGSGGDMPALTAPLQPPPPELADAPYFTIQTRTGWSKYKEWPAEWWNVVLAHLRNKYPLLVPVLIAAEDEPILRGVDRSHVGKSLSHAIRVFSGARFHLGLDSFCNHLSHFYWANERGARMVRSVILWGSTQASAAGYDTNINIVRPPAEGCQPCFKETAAWSRAKRGPCENLTALGTVNFHKCMAAIRPADVITAADELAAVAVATMPT